MVTRTLDGASALETRHLWIGETYSLRCDGTAVWYGRNCYEMLNEEFPYSHGPRDALCSQVSPLTSAHPLVTIPWTHAESTGLPGNRFRSAADTAPCLMRPVKSFPPYPQFRRRPEISAPASKRWTRDFLLVPATSGLRRVFGAFFPFLHSRSKTRSGSRLLVVVHSDPGLDKT